MNFDKWFEKQSLVVQIILLLVPVVNWVVEILVRLSAYLRNKNGWDLLFLILVAVLGVAYVLEILDIVFILLRGKMFFPSLVTKPAKTPKRKK